MRKIVKTLRGETFEIPPIWLMRQAGRYLPEYRKIREKSGSFLDLCYNSELAVKVALQPIERFGLDGCILFSDILVIPDSLGQRVKFLEGKGPVLEPVGKNEISLLRNSNPNNEKMLEKLKPIFETLQALRTKLPNEITLIGFCGAPWTVSTYMIAGHGTCDQAPARLFALQHPESFQSLIDLLVRVSSDYLIRQLKAGADVVQIFDSWAGVLDEEQFHRWCVQPVASIVKNVRREIPDALIISFPKGAGHHYYRYKDQTKVDGLGIDWTLPLDFVKKLQADGAVQGVLDPLKLVAGGRALDENIDRIIEVLTEKPFIFNLGHGILPDTPISHVDQLISRVRNNIVSCTNG